jgi:hypothetical protein
MIKRKSMVCACGKTARYVENLRFNSYRVDGWRCPSCGEIYYNPDKAQKILLLNKTCFAKKVNIADLYNPSLARRLKSRKEPKLNPKFIAKMKKADKQKSVKVSSFSKRYGRSV